MVFLSVFIGENSDFNDTPFLAINKLSSVVLIYIFWYLSFIYLYAKVWNAESAQSLYQINVYDKASQQSQLLSCVKSVFYFCLAFWNYFIKKISQSLLIDNSFWVYITPENKVFHE